MKAKIITIGDEILIGQIVDSNSAWIASELTKLGFFVTSILSISDNSIQIKDTIKSSLLDNELIILTGGLGPTKDDITKNTLCELFNSTLVFNNDVYADVEAFLIQRGANMNRLNKDQALFPKDATLLRNRQGTAPGIWFEKDNKVVISLPGVPWEMRGIYKDEIEFRLKKQFNLPENYYQTIMISGIGESPLALKLENWENNLPDCIKVAYLPSLGLMRLRLGILEKTAKISKEIVEKEVEKLHIIISKYIISDTEASLQEIVFKALHNSNKTLSTAESCTGGSIAQMITEIPGSSKIFKGSIVAYANETKTNLLGVNPSLIEQFGAVSQLVVEQMAEGAKKALNTDYSVATSGIAGPDGGTDEKPVGLVWISVSGPNGTVSEKFLFGKEREINIKRSAIAALNMLRQVLLEDT
ncbi:MAG: competence/damage-inducible protein A [Salinivirgaceae bacterium]|jgi:nicotinamide-nucleotide amidase|nr:competence/damage-inducible protein A [Salinivirgaceae bacterium]